MAARNKLLGSIRAIAFKGLEAVEEEYHHANFDLKFWQEKEILLKDPRTGELNESVWDVLPELEDIEPGRPFDPLDLTPAHRQALGLPHVELAYGSWGENNSAVLPELGRSKSGAPRRLAIADIFWRIDPPKVDDQDESWLNFSVL